MKKAYLNRNCPVHVYEDWTVGTKHCLIFFSERFTKEGGGAAYPNSEGKKYTILLPNGEYRYSDNQTESVNIINEFGWELCWR